MGKDLVRVVVSSRCPTPLIQREPNLAQTSPPRVRRRGKEHPVSNAPTGLRRVLSIAGFVLRLGANEVLDVLQAYVLLCRSRVAFQGHQSLRLAR
jgi:hypothetical protein